MDISAVQRVGAQQQIDDRRRNEISCWFCCAPNSFPKSAGALDENEGKNKKRKNSGALFEEQSNEVQAGRCEQPTRASGIEPTHEGEKGEQQRAGCDGFATCGDPPHTLDMDRMQGKHSRGDQCGALVSEPLFSDLED